jgi:hypothetical protein
MLVSSTECRGFVFAAPVAIALKVPFVPLRKPGKLPCKSIGVDFKQSAGKGSAFFGKDRLEMHEVMKHKDERRREGVYQAPESTQTLHAHHPRHTRTRTHAHTHTHTEHRVSNHILVKTHPRPTVDPAQHKDQHTIIAVVLLHTSGRA